MYLKVANDYNYCESNDQYLLGSNQLMSMANDIITIKLMTNIYETN